MTDPAPSASSAEPTASTSTSAPSAEPTFEEGHDAVKVIEDRSDYLAAVAAIAAGHGPVAVDAERASGYRYSSAPYLIQVFRRGAGAFLFDPIAIGSFAELQDAIVDEEWLSTPPRRTCRACARSGSCRPGSSTPNSAPASPASPAWARRRRRAAARHHAGQGALGRGLVHPPAPPVLARVRRARRRAPARPPRRPGRGARRGRQDDDRRTGVRRRPAPCTEAAPRRTLAPTVRHARLRGARPRHRPSLWTARDAFAQETDIAPAGSSRTPRSSPRRPPHPRPARTWPP